MPDPPFDTMQESIKFVGASFEGPAICFGTNETRPPPWRGPPFRYAGDSDDSGKAVVVEDETDVSGVTGKELTNVASPSSSSSSTVPESQDMCNNLASGSSSQHTADVPEAPPISMRSLAITPMNESEAHLYWRNREPTLFEDTPEQTNIGSGLGYHEIMRLMDSQHDADLHQLQGPAEDLLMPSTSIVTFQVPGFSMGMTGGIVPFAEWQSVEDPGDVGLANLDIFMNP